RSEQIRGYAVAQSDARMASAGRQLDDAQMLARVLGKTESEDSVVVQLGQLIEERPALAVFVQLALPAPRDFAHQTAAVHADDATMAPSRELPRRVAIRRAGAEPLGHRVHKIGRRGDVPAVVFDIPQLREHAEHE